MLQLTGASLQGGGVVDFSNKIQLDMEASHDIIHVRRCIWAVLLYMGIGIVLLRAVNGTWWNTPSGCGAPVAGTACSVENRTFPFGWKYGAQIARHFVSLPLLPLLRPLLSLLPLCSPLALLRSYAEPDEEPLGRDRERLLHRHHHHH